MIIVASMLWISQTGLIGVPVGNRYSGGMALIRNEELRVLKEFETLQRIFQSMGVREKILFLAFSLTFFAALILFSLLTVLRYQ